MNAKAFEVQFQTPLGAYSIVSNTLSVFVLVDLQKIVVSLTSGTICPK